METKVWVPSGVLGSGFAPETVARGLELGPDAIAIDAGSTDSGPHYLGTGTSKMTREAVAHDLRQLLRARERLGCPLLVGSCGTCGVDAAVDWVGEIVLELLAEESLSAKVTLLYAEQRASLLKEKLAAGRLRPLAPAAELTAADLNACEHIVALLGAEPYIAALAAGADIVLGGRTTDTAVLSAAPLLRGCPPGPTWHAAKIAECGAFCTTQPASGGVVFTVDDTGFDIEPLSAGAACTPRTVSAHMLYENADPYRLNEPGGCLDVSQAHYRALSERRVRVEGAQWQPQPYTLKLEGAAAAGFQTLLLVGVQDPDILARLNRWLSNLDAYLRAKLADVLALSETDYDLSLRAYGLNAVSGGRVRASEHVPREVGLLLTVTAPSQDLATRIAKLCNPYLLHFPLRRGDPLPSFAFPFSPAEIERGPVYAFRLNHVVEVEDALELVRTASLTKAHHADPA